MLENGLSAGHLKKTYSHNLKDLYNYCLENGLIHRNNSVKLLFEKYNSKDDQGLRYFAGLEDVFASSVNDDEFVSLETYIERVCEQR